MNHNYLKESGVKDFYILRGGKGLTGRSVWDHDENVVVDNDNDVVDDDNDVDDVDDDVVVDDNDVVVVDDNNDVVVVDDDDAW